MQLQDPWIMFGRSCLRVPRRHRYLVSCRQRVGKGEASSGGLNISGHSSLDYYPVGPVED